MNEVQTTRTPEIIAGEIRVLTATMLTNIVEIGRRMCEAKELLPHGEFGTWIKEQTGYSVSTANNFMKLFSEYADQQIGLFGASVNSQTIGNLPYTKALLLLSVPSEEREEFAKNNDVANLSNAELKKAIKERDEALAKVEELEGVRDDISSALNEITSDRNRLKEEIKELSSRPVDAVVTATDKADVEKAVEEALKVSAEEHKAEMDALMKKIEAETKKAEKLEKAVIDAEKKAEEAKEKASSGVDKYILEAKRANEEVDKLRREIQMADPVTAEFKGIFEQTSVMVSKLLTIAKNAPSETSPKLFAALQALGKQLGGVNNG